MGAILRNIANSGQWSVLQIKQANSDVFNAIKFSDRDRHSGVNAMLQLTLVLVKCGTQDVMALYDLFNGAFGVFKVGVLRQAEADNNVMAVVCWLIATGQPLPFDCRMGRKRRDDGAGF